MKPSIHFEFEKQLALQTFLTDFAALNLSKMYLRIFGVIAIMTTTFASANAQCDNLEPEDSIYGYREREGRCEGFYKANVSGFAIAVVSFTHGNIAYAMNSNEKLKISTNPLDNFNSVSVQGTNFLMNKNYRLDLELKKGEVATIPVKDVLEPNKLDPAHLGLLGYVERSGFRYFVPVTPSSELSGSSAGEKNLKLAISATIDLKKVVWRYAVTQGDLCGNYSDIVVLPASSFLRNSPIELQIPTAILEKGNEIGLCIQLSVLGTNGMEFNENIRLLIPKDS
ncbi:hypothetical protein GCM10009119_10890 [Algoriphagus jejuensis]|uniref:Uncharacterized protein n=1 Tax=Algoriphagus jejuensis TaxID=419934 RepID=A0ABN1MXA9_9BACT